MSVLLPRPLLRHRLREAVINIDWRHRPEISTESLILAASAFFALACNGLFWRSAADWSDGGIGLMAALLGVLVCVHALLLGVLAWRWNAKMLLGVLFLSTAMTVHYMSRYNVYIDADMLRNVLNTDRKESRELITPALLWPLLGYGVLPVVVLWRLRLRRRSAGRALLVRAHELASRPCACVRYGISMLTR